MELTFTINGCKASIVGTPEDCLVHFQAVREAYEGFAEDDILRPQQAVLNQRELDELLPLDTLHDLNGCPVKVLDDEPLVTNATDNILERILINVLEYGLPGVVPPNDPTVRQLIANHENRPLRPEWKLGVLMAMPTGEWHE